MVGGNQGDFSQKRISATVQGPCVQRDIVRAAAAWPGNREKWGHYLFPLRVSHGLKLVGQQGLTEVAVPRKTYFNRGTELP